MVIIIEKGTKNIVTVMTPEMWNNWEFNRKLPKTDIVLGHGHITSTGNKDSISEQSVYDNIINC